MFALTSISPTEATPYFQQRFSYDQGERRQPESKDPTLDFVKDPTLDFVDYILDPAYRKTANKHKFAEKNWTFFPDYSPCGLLFRAFRSY